MPNNPFNKTVPCKHRPELFADTPMGMYHCPECGVMVLAGLEHPAICNHSGHADYAAQCNTCTPGWDENL